MKGIIKLTSVVAKILEIVHWIAAGLMAAAGICAAVKPDWVRYFMDIEAFRADPELSVYGFEIAVCGADGAANMTALALFAIGAVAIFVIVAWISRSLYGVVRCAETKSPFCDENIRRLRGIGILSIAIPVVGFVMSTAIRLILGADTVESSLHFDGLIMGIIVLCLTQFFIYGATLERDVDGLL